MTGVVGEFELSFEPCPNFAGTRATTLDIGGPFAAILEPVLSANEAEHLGAAARAASQVQADRHGRAGTDGPLGSTRASAFSTSLANVLWERIRSSVPADVFPGWHPVGVADLFRFITYRGHGLLVAHYDAPFIAGPNRRSDLSVVIYLDTPAGGRTRFITDTTPDPGYADWDRPAQPEEVAAEVDAAAGRAVMFKHRVLHDSEPVPAGVTKTIVRTDIMFERNL